VPIVPEAPHAGTAPPALPRQIMLLVYSLLRIAVTVYLLSLVIGLIVANRLIFPKVTPSYEPGPPYIEIPVGERDEHITARYYYVPDAPWTILYSHGNGEDLGMIDSRMAWFASHGYSVLAYDYRGYGRSSGTPSEQKTYEDILAAYDYLVEEKHVPPSTILVWGFSLGGGPSTWLAENKRVGALLLESSFVSSFRVKTRWPIFPFDRFPNQRRLRNVYTPTLVVHGEADNTIPLWHGKALASATRGPARTLFVPEARHGDLVELTGDSFWEALRTFLNEVVE